MIERRDLGLEGPAVFPVRRYRDHRGWFSELCSDRWLAKAGIAGRFIQDNLSQSDHVGTLRGLHAQRSPMTQAKLIMVLSGAIFDVVVDCRKGSPTFGHHRSLTMDIDAPSLLYVPAGFCHGFLTVKPATTVFYKIDRDYSPEHEVGIRWDDPDLRIDWPLAGNTPIVSARDREFPSFSQLQALE